MVAYLYCPKCKSEAERRAITSPAAGFLKADIEGRGAPRKRVKPIHTTNTQCRTLKICETFKFVFQNQRALSILIAVD